jgi:hypothetical protein
MLAEDYTVLQWFDGECPQVKELVVKCAQPRSHTHGR